MQGDLTVAKFSVDVYVNLAGTHAFYWGYWMGGTRFQKIIVDLYAMISLHQVRPFLTSIQWREIKAVLSMIGHILWDNDFVPMENWRSFNMGTANMPVQYSGMRSMIACLLKDHPQFSAKFADILETTLNLFNNSTTAYGAPKDCPHYAGAMITPTVDVFRQFQVAGYADVFAPSSSIYDRLIGLAEWMMQVLTPPQARFGGLRKMVAYGDGWAEGSDMFIQMMMGFETHDLTLSKRLSGAWAAWESLWIVLRLFRLESAAELPGTGSSFG